MRRAWLRGPLVALALLALASLPAGAAPGPSLVRIANSPKPGTQNTNLAFWGHLVYAGDYGGFRVIDVTEPSRPVVLADVACHGKEGDVTVWGGLLFLSDDEPQTTSACDSHDAADTNDPSTWEGLRIFDVSNPRAPRFVTAIATDCGSHTNTVVPDQRHKRVLVYVAAYVGQGGPHCGQGREANPRHGKIVVIGVPLAAPEHARIVSQPQLVAPVFHVGGAQLPSISCHEITVFLPLHLAAASCLTDGQLWDISDPARPRTLHAVHIDEPHVTFWHSAAFTWDGRYVVFSDESLTGSCNSPGKDLDGRLWFYELKHPQKPLSSFTLPHRVLGDCSVHMFDVIPVRGRYLLVAGWYQGGVDVIDFTNPRRPREVAHYMAAGPPSSNVWSAYWYDGNVYANDIGRGLDVLALRGAGSGAVHLSHLDPQTQELLLR